MNLRRQLLLVSLLLLSLPWAGCQFVREMEGALRTGQEKSLQATTRSVATVLRDHPELIYPNTDRLHAAADSRPSIYAGTTTQAMIIDGYADGWEDVPSLRFASEQGNSDLAVSYRALTRGDRLYLLLNVTDPKVVYHHPGMSREPNGDRVRIQTWQDNRRQDYIIATAAPGSVTASFDSAIRHLNNAGSIRGQWQDSSDGYTLELELPLAITGGRLGFHVINSNGREGETFDFVGNTSPRDSTAPPWLIYTPSTLARLLAPFEVAGTGLEIIDKYQWLIANFEAQAEPVGIRDEQQTFWLLRWLYRRILAGEPQAIAPVGATPGKSAGPEIDAALIGQAIQQRYVKADESARTTLAAAAPIFHQNNIVGAVVMRQSSEEYLSLTDQAFSRLLLYSLLALAIGILGLLGFASLLSWRIHKLSQAADAAVLPDGSVTDNFPRSTAADEIGALSRQYAELLDRVRQNNDYLRTLSRKLSHELRTPVAMIRTSLENLELPDHALPAESRIYIQRSREGLDRLGNILNAMSEASGLEASIRNNELTRVDLVPLLKEITPAYRGIYPDHQLVLNVTATRADVQACSDLLAQSLDKCMDNAASFCPTQGVICLSLHETENAWSLEIANEGPPLPAAMQGQLFESMVSVREQPGTSVHLGLGLHIVRLIADFHQARVDIHNREDGSGVAIRMLLPKA